MADSTINGLTALTGANVDNTADQFAIWDNSENTTKKITRTEVLTGVPAGTAAAPSMTPTGDSNTGVYFPAADTLGLVSGGTERVRVNSAGLVGFGTQSPQSRIHSVSNIAAANHDWTSQFVAPTVGFLAASNDSSAWIRIATYNSNPTHDPYINFLTAGGQNWSIGTDNSDSDNLKVAMAAGFSGSNEFLTIDTAGKVGIGKTPTLGLLDVNGDAYFNTVRVGLGNGGVATNTAVGKGCLAAVTSGGLNVAVGENAGDAITTGSSNTIIGQGTDPSANNGTGQIVIGKGVTGTANNRITVGITTNIAELDLDGTDTSWAASSDERLKKNVADYAAGLDVITALRPVTYQWRSRKEVPTELTNYYANSDEPVHGDASKTYHGFIAQEVKAVLDANPSVPNGQHLWEQRDDGVQTLAPADLVPILVNAIKQLHAEIQTLKNK